MTTKTDEAELQEIPRLTRNFNRPARTRVFKGGRGSGKTRGLALRSALRVYELAEADVRGVFLASREHLNSLDESSMEEIKAAIRSVDWLADYFDIGEKYIRTKNRRISYAFAGLRHNLDSIKSKARIVGNWTDEAENVSEVAWRKLVNTLREEGDVTDESGSVHWIAENWISYNPESSDSATHKRFVADPAPDCIVTTVNWKHNPWFGGLLNASRLEDLRLRPDTYEHVWNGAFLTLTEAQIFAGKFAVEEFEPGRDWDGPYQGLDFGFAQDPTAAVRCFIRDRTLWIRNEAGKTKLELDATSGFINGKIPGFDAHVTRADSARPESISFLTRHGLPRITGVKKWPGSVEDGIAFIKSFDRVVIHPDCPQTAREFRLYSYKVDRLSGDVLPVIVDANNHFCIAEGELIRCRRGDVPIEAVTTSDEVLTRDGWRRVLFSGQTGSNRRTLDVLTTAGRVRCTPEHRIWTARGFVRAEALRYADIVISNEPRPWSSILSGMAGAIADTQKATTCLIESISAAHSLAGVNIFTGTSGSTIAVKFRTAMKFITSMKIHLTTTSATSSAFPRPTTRGSTPSMRKGWRGRGGISTASGHSPKPGIVATKVVSGIGKLGLWPIRGSTPSQSAASSAGDYSSLGSSGALIASVQTPARALGEGPLGWMTRPADALSAGAISPSTDTNRQSFARGRVLAVREAGICERVYDLTVEGAHEFFAGGVLVHNCDALRYALAPIIQARGAVTVTPLRM